MSNYGRRDPDDALPIWMRESLRRPVATRAADVERIMARVRGAAGVAGAPARVPGPKRRRSSRMLLLGVALAASLVGGGAVIGLGSARTLWRASFPAPLEASATLIGDSIVSTLHDTLGLVRFALRVRGASRVVLAGNFNGWSASATPLARRPGTEQWTAVVPLHRDDSRYAFLVDDTRWVGAPRVALARATPNSSASSTSPASPAARTTRDST